MWLILVIIGLVLFFSAWNCFYQTTTSKYCHHYHKSKAHTQVVECFHDPKVHEIKKKLLQIVEDEPQLQKKIHECTWHAHPKSYTVDKKHVHLCLLDENGDYYQDNMLIYVALHELSHVLCDEIGHTKKFESIFQMLLDKAKRSDLFNPEQPLVGNYCEHNLDFYSSSTPRAWEEDDL